MSTLNLFRLLRCFISPFSFARELISFVCLDCVHIFISRCLSSSYKLSYDSFYAHGVQTLSRLYRYYTSDDARALSGQKLAGPCLHQALSRISKVSSLIACYKDLFQFKLQLPQFKLNVLEGILITMNYGETLRFHIGSAHYCETIWPNRVRWKLQFRLWWKSFQRNRRISVHAWAHTTAVEMRSCDSGVCSIPGLARFANIPFPWKQFISFAWLCTYIHIMLFEFIL